MNKANECTCPSGDGSLVHPCPAHPAVEQACWDERKLSDLGNELHNLSCSIVHENEKLAEQIGGIARELWNWPQACAALAQPSPAHPAPVEQAGGDERDFQAKGAQEVPSPVSKEYDRHLIGLLRKGEALPGHQEEAADEIERLRDWNDHLNNTVLPNILNPNFLMLMKGGERLLDLCTKDGEFIGVSLNDMKDVFDWMVTHARIAPDQAALAQPSPASDLDPLNLAPHAEAFNEAPAEALKPEPAEADRPEVVAWQYRVTAGPQTGWSLWHPGKGEEFERSYTVERRPLMTVAQHERITAQLHDALDESDGDRWKLRSERDAANARLHEVATACATAEQERDAALAEVAGLRSLLNSLLCYVERDIDRMRSDRDKSDNKEIYDRSISLAMERLKAAQNAVFTTEPGCDTAVELAAQTTQAQHSVPVAREQLERLVRILDAHNYAKDAEALMALLAAAPAQAQHSVPEGLALIPVRETEAMHDAVMALLYKGVARTDTQKLLDAYIAAAPQPAGGE
ncbi:hypothetical protein [Pseudomonas aeruginosa]|uniref:hypothetical protein n=1 Tax=Pseudomonas aeruginosa TaxID=287 RepID=UPI003EE421E8|nr:hypothetical protein [Pseudomonas aeruginosa]